MDDLFIRDGLIVPAAAMSWKAVPSPGPGGQHVNKTASKVELLLDFTKFERYPPGARLRLQNRPELRFTALGELQITESQERSQHRNLQRARERLAQILREGLVIPKRRRPTRPSKASVRRRLDAKRQVADKKKARQQKNDHD